MQIDFYWDIGSTNTYFAYHLLRPLAARFNATIVYHPFNLGYVFRHHNYALGQEPRAKMKNRKDDLMRWAQRFDLAFQVPSEFPIKTSRVLRGALVMREYGLEEQYMDEIFRRYWEENDASIQHYDGLGASVAKLGVDVDQFVARAESEQVRQSIITQTNDALAAGIFGAPSMVLGDELLLG